VDIDLERGTISMTNDLGDTFTTVKVANDSTTIRAVFYTDAAGIKQVGLAEHNAAVSVAGGVARAAKLTPERRREIARMGARARWGRNNRP
jgi:hypothetical protein